MCITVNIEWPGQLKVLSFIFHSTLFLRSRHTGLGSWRNQKNRVLCLFKKFCWSWNFFIFFVSLLASCLPTRELKGESRLVCVVASGNVAIKTASGSKCKFSELIEMNFMAANEFLYFISQSKVLLLTFVELGCGSSLVTLFMNLFPARRGLAKAPATDLWGSSYLEDGAVQ